MADWVGVAAPGGKLGVVDFVGPQPALKILKFRYLSVRLGLSRNRLVFSHCTSWGNATIASASRAR